MKLTSEGGIRHKAPVGTGTYETPVSYEKGTDRDELETRREGQMRGSDEGEGSVFFVGRRQYVDRHWVGRGLITSDYLVTGGP